MKSRARYPTDLTDAEWDLLRDVVPQPRPGPQEPKYDRREIVNAIRYKLRTGCGWEHLPHDLPPWKSASGYFYRWRDDGTFARMVEALRGQTRRAAGRAEQPTMAIVDSQSTKTTESGGPKGFDGGKRVKGRKRHLAVDILGLLIAVVVTAASASDQAACAPLLRRVKGAAPEVSLAIGDSHYQGPIVTRAAAAVGITVEVRSRLVDTSGFEPIPIRWRVERSFAWMNRWRELSKEYTRVPESTEAWIHVGFAGLMAHRLTATTA